MIIKKALEHIRLNIIPYSLFFILTIIMTYPLVIYFFSHPISVYGDKYQFIWNIWWVNKCILEFKDIYTIDYLFYPFSFSGVFHTFSIFPILITIPFYHLFGPVFVYNLIAFLSFFLAGVFMYKLVLYLTKDMPSAFIAGIIFAFNPVRIRMVSSGGYFNMHFDAFVPLFVLFFLKMLKTGRYRYAIISSLAFISIFYTEYQLTVYTVITGAVIFAYFFIRNIRKKAVLINQIKNGLFFAFIVLILAVPVLRQLDQVEYTEMTYTPEEHIVGLNLMIYMSSALFRGNLYRYIGSIFPDLARYALPLSGWAVLLLFIFSILFIKTLKTSPGWMWLFLLMVFFILSFGCYFTISPNTGFSFPTPYLLFAKVPVLNAIRAPWRIASFVFFSLAVFIGMHYRSITEYLSSRIKKDNKKKVLYTLNIMLCFLIFAEYINIPLKTALEYDDISSHYALIRQDKDDCSVLEMPVSWLWAKGYVDVFSVLYMYYPAFHNKREVNGYVSKLPPYIFNYFKELPLFRVFILMQDGKIPDDKLIEEAQNVSEGFVKLADLKYIVVHKRFLEKLKYKHKGYDFIPDYLDLVRRVFPVLEERTDDQGNIMFILEKAKDIKRNTYRMSDKDIRAYIARGVFPEVEGGELRWITGNSAIFAFPNQGHKYSRVRIFGFPQYAEGKKQTIKVSINGRTAYEGTVEKEPSYIDIEMEDEDFRDKNIFLDLEFAYSISARELGTGNDTRSLSYMIREIIFEE